MLSSPKTLLRLFGTPSIVRPDETFVTGRAAQRHRLALLALLALSPTGGLPREKALVYLWPESDPDHARDLLNQAVYVIRKALGETAVVAGREELQLNRGVVEVDVEQFEDAVARGDF